MFLVLVLLPLLVARPVPAAQSTAAGEARISRLVTARSVGGLQLDASTTYRRVLRYFRPLGSRGFQASFSVWGCTLRWRRAGLAIEFDPRGATSGRATPDACAFARATVLGPAWHTSNGLRVGWSIRSLRQLFPRATDTGLGKPPPGMRNWCAYWSLTTTSSHAAQPVLMAYTIHGHVAALGIAIFGH